MNKTLNNDIDRSMKILIHIGGLIAFIQAFSVIFAIIGYFIWPHVFTDAKVIFEGINANPVIYFMKLDPIVIIGTLLQLPVWLSLRVLLLLFFLSTIVGVIATLLVGTDLLKTFKLLNEEI